MNTSLMHPLHGERSAASYPYPIPAITTLTPLLGNVITHERRNNMMNKTKWLSATTAIAAFMLQMSPAFSETVTTTETTRESPTGITTKTTVTTDEPIMAPTSTSSTTSSTWTSEEHSTHVTGARVINFMDFDLVKDGLLSINEVGEMLFKLYDMDGNNVIDNIEYERRAVFTIMPMEKNTIVSYDFDGDGIADKTKYTQETFMKDTMLTRFDKNRDGLSPHEFMGTFFLAADINNDKAIDLQEWQGSYRPEIDKENRAKSPFNK